MFLKNWLLIVLLTSALPLFCHGQAFPVRVSWRIANERQTLHEPVIAIVAIENFGQGALIADFGANYTQGLLVTVQPPNGIMDRRALVQSSGVARLGRVRIEAGEVHVRQIVVTEWYNFDAPGQYEIRIEMRNPIKFGELGTYSVPAAVLTVLVGPRDETALRQQCESLAARIIAPLDIEDSLAAAKALASVRDPVAVPYILRSLSTQYLVAQGIVLHALKKFDEEPEAVDALITVALGPDPGDAAWARSTLFEAAPRMDSELRARVYRILGRDRQ